MVEAAERGTLREVWGTGTAAVISPVGELSYKGRKIVINGADGELLAEVGAIGARQQAPVERGFRMVVAEVSTDLILARSAGSARERELPLHG